MNVENYSIMQVLGNRRLDQLDGLRGVCALCVLMCHLVAKAIQHTNLGLYPTLFIHSISVFGLVSVLVFFVLSGFVIGYTTPNIFTWEEAKKYILKRLIRLYPIYVFAILLTFALLDKPFNILDVMGHLVFMQGWLVPIAYNNIPLWSLHYEFIFYILFLVVWKFNINVNKAIYICVLSGIVSGIFRCHPLEILGYFTLWLSGFWLAKNIEKFKLVSHNYMCSGFWTPSILASAFLSQNILTMVVFKFGALSYALPSLLLSVLITSIVASLIVETKNKISFWYNWSFGLVFLSVISSIIFAWKQNKFYSANQVTSYQSAGFEILILPFTIFFRKVPVEFFREIAYLGSFSYALYLIHYPLIEFVYNFSLLKGFQNVPFSWIANLLCVLVISLLFSWILECYLHVKISKQLKIYFKLK